ncbi:hypothetical protein ACVI1K_003499 [Bradyrhizobium sp. USDA 4508]
MNAFLCRHVCIESDWALHGVSFGRYASFCISFGM